MRKFSIIVFPGSNCDEDIHYALNHILKQEAIKIWHRDTIPLSCDCVILPGGFSYGDYLRPGAIAHSSPVIASIVNFAKKGKYVVGICNGFQILTEIGLLPGTLLYNLNQKFICFNQYIKPVNMDTVLTRELDRNTAYNIPLAHAEGRYFIPDNDLKALEENNQILFQYTDKEGNISKNTNPNGSVKNIAGVCNKQKNVLGIMPHPERAANELLDNIDGKYLLDSLINCI